MRHAKRVILSLLLACSRLFAQTNPHVRLHDALVLQQQGHFEKAIAVIKQVTDYQQVSGAELGRAYIMLGIAYQQEGNFSQAQPAFEQSLRILERDPEHTGDYAAALHNYAGLYNDSGQLEVAARMWIKALHVRQQTGDHAAITRSLASLAGVALAQKRVREARKYLKQASDEAKLAAGQAGNNLTDDDLAMLSETQAWLALTAGHAAAAVEGYQRALDLCKRSRGEQHWLTGWEYMLRGKAYARAGDIERALVDMQKGLEILDHAVGRRNPKYFAAQFAYSQVLDQTGSHAKAAQLRATTERASKEFYGHQCVGCTIGVTAFR
jgi:tetratricopeptide (TPR) repeat protein